MTIIKLTSQIPEDLHGLRLDQALAKLFPDYSREKLKDWVKHKFVLVDGEPKRPRDKVTSGQVVEIDAELTESTVEPQPIDLDIIFEDDDVLVINKPVGLVVHPGAGNPDNTLQNALLHYEPTLKAVPRAGLVHRLDKDTSGLLVIAKSLPAHTSLTAKMQAREIKREYRAIVIGQIISGGKVDAPIGRHPHSRIKMAVVNSGKHAITHYRVLEKFTGFTYLQVQLETGRTHQIRVHMAHIKHPILGDPVYEGHLRINKKNLTPQALEAITTFHRQALHAYRLVFTHPITGEEVECIAPFPEDFSNLLDAIRGSVKN